MSADCDCVIVGGGIGGAVLALSLAQHKHTVTILEKEPSPVPIARPEILASSTISTFDALGVGRRIRLEAALPLSGLRLWQKGGKPLLEITRDDFDKAGVQPYSTDSVRTRQILLEEALNTRFIEIRRGVEVTGLVRENGRVAGVRAKAGGNEVVYRCRLVVGDDGGASRVRQALGIPLALTPFAVDFLAIKRSYALNGKENIGQAWLDPPALSKGLAAAIVMPVPEGRAASVFILNEKSHQAFAETPQRFIESASRLLPQAAAVFNQNAFPDQFVHLKRPFGHAPSYVADSAALLGDAAHPVTPAGGQGANMSVADAMALAEVAHQALKDNDVSARRLSAYESVRRPANQRSLSISIGANRVIRLAQRFPWLSGLIPLFLSQQNKPEAKQRLLRGVSQAFVSVKPAVWFLSVLIAVNAAAALSEAAIGRDSRYEPKPVARSAVGCSFSFGYAVDDQDTYPWQLQEFVPQFRVRNFAVPGYGTYQAVLRLKRFFASQSHAAGSRTVIYGMIQQHASRNTNEGDWLQLLNALSESQEVRLPYCRLGSSGQLVCHPANESSAQAPNNQSAQAPPSQPGVDPSESRLVTELLLRELAQISREHQARLLVAYLNGQDASSWKAFFDGQKIDFCDVRPAAVTEGWYTSYEGHPSVLFYRYVAQRIAECLK